jgi:hypothetical protein
MVTDAEKREKMIEFFRRNAYHPLYQPPEKNKKKDSSGWSPR